MDFKDRPENLHGIRTVCHADEDAQPSHCRRKDEDRRVPCRGPLCRIRIKQDQQAEEATQQTPALDS